MIKYRDFRTPKRQGTGILSGRRGRARGSWAGLETGDIPPKCGPECGPKIFNIEKHSIIQIDSRRVLVPPSRQTLPIALYSAILPPITALTPSATARYILQISDGSKRPIADVNRIRRALFGLVSIELPGFL